MAPVKVAPVPATNKVVPAPSLVSVVAVAPFKLPEIKALLVLKIVVAPVPLRVRSPRTLVWLPPPKPRLRGVVTVTAPIAVLAWKALM